MFLGLVDLGEGTTGVDDEEAEDGLGEKVKEGVSVDFGVSSELVGAFSEKPNDRVAGPGDSSEHGDLVVNILDFLGLVGLGGVLEVDEKVVDDRGKHEHTEAEESVLFVTLNEGTDKASNDHKEIDTEKEKASVSGGARETEEVDEHERGSEGPINVTGVEELTAVEGTEVVAVASGHDHVGEGGNEGDHESHDVVEAGFVLGGLVHEVAGGDEEAEESYEEGLVAVVRKFRFAFFGNDGLVVGIGGRIGEAKHDKESGGRLHSSWY
jgi:hypothetical protein